MKISVIGLGIYSLAISKMLAKKSENEIIIWTENEETYEEYKKGAQKFAQEHGLPEMSDSEMKESYTSYITKQPIIPKTEMKSMPEREVSTPIQEQNTKNNDLSQDRYYRMKAEQTKESNFSQSGYEEIKNSENIEPTETPSSSKSTSTLA